MKKIDEITTELEQGVQDVLQSDKYRGFLEMMSRFYNYSACNCILIMRQFPEATLVAGYNAWRDKFHRQVKKGEKAIRILAPCPHKKLTVDEDGNEKEVRWTTFRATNVFDISQTEGEELPTMCNRLTDSVEGYEHIIEVLKGISPVPVVFRKIAGTAAGYFSQNEKEIVVCEGMSEAQTVKTLVHEIAHSILHDKDTGTEKDADRNTRELQAESVAYTVCKYMGLDTSEYSFEYVATWSGEAKEIAKSLEVIRKTAKGIIDQIAA